MNYPTDTWIENLSAPYERFVIRPTREEYNENRGYSTTIPGCKITWEINEYGERVCNINRLARDWAKAKLMQGLIKDTHGTIQRETINLIGTIKTELQFWDLWKRGIVREYVPRDLKQELQYKAMASQIPQTILKQAVKDKVGNLVKEVEKTSDTPYEESIVFKTKTEEAEVHANE